jgi:hypothetical protein
MKERNSSRALNKAHKNFRLTPETVRKLETGARQYGTSKTGYVEMALQNQFRKDRIR